VYPIVQGIPDLIPRQQGQPLRHYRTESLYDMIAPYYDVAVPIMSLAIWNCSPLRYVDWAHRAMGRAEGGVLLVNPVGTGILVGHTYSIHTRFPIVCIDNSWEMLRRAQARFERAGIENATLIRAESENLPLLGGSVRAVLTMNGLNGFYDRGRALREMARVTEQNGVVVGSALCRGLGQAADTMLNLYERWGIYPILRSREFLLKELSLAFHVPEVYFETHGAVVFFVVALADHAPRTSPSPP
jgi:ubiquinone/menaquinone biosynthesis C-methylase UbiE